MKNIMRNMTVALAIAGAMLPCLVHGDDEDKPTRPTSIHYPLRVSVVGVLDVGSREDVFYGLSFGILMNLEDNTVGIKGASFFNLSDEITGLQIAGLANAAWKVNGLQIALLGNGSFEFASKDENAKSLVTVNGMQLALINGSKELNGLQVGFENHCDDVQSGIQLGIINRSKTARGLQLGIYNQADSLKGVQIGLLNRHGDFFLPVVMIGW